MAVCQNLVPLVNIKIAGKWMFIPLKMVCIGIDPYPSVFPNFLNRSPRVSVSPVLLFRRKSEPKEVREPRAMVACRCAILGQTKFLGSGEKTSKNLRIKEDPCVFCPVLHVFGRRASGQKADDIPMVA